MSHLKIRYLLLIICKCLTITTSYEPVQQSPCPNVFEYEYDSRNNLYGIIRVPTPNSYNNVILLEIQLSVGNRVQGSNGNIGLISPRDRIIDDLLQNKPIYYRLEFPYWNNVPPRVTQISVNGNQICFGFPIDRNSVPAVTTINLQHTLTISVPLSTGPKVNNEADVPFVDNLATRGTAYPFNIPNTKPRNPIFNFKPQTPRDPTKIYAANPFLNPNNNDPTPFYDSYKPIYQNPNNNDPTPFYGKLNPSDYNFEPNQFTNSYKPVYQTQPMWSRPDSNGNYYFTFGAYPSGNPSPPITSEPPQFNYQDVTQRPQNQFSIQPVTRPPKPATRPPTIETHFRPTRAPYVPDVDELPTVESNFIKKPFSGVCGISVNANALLINGNRVPKGVHPWLAALFKQDDEGLKFICGSTLISQKHVVTAAHCVQTRRKKVKPEDLWTVLGRENIQRWSNDGAQIVQAESTHVHPDFKFSSADADIAVIILSEEAVFSSLIKPICLWTSEQNQKLIVEKKGTVVGWGKDQTGKVSTPEPRQLTFPVVSEEDCLRSNLGFREITSNRTFCAGYRNNSGPCNGDSGSGFLMHKNGRWTLRGIVSTSLRGDDGGCDLMQYIVFTDVAVFTEWLMGFLN